jgi:hypothetical protein
MRPIAQASWRGRAIQAFVGPAFVYGAHPLARVGGVTNGIVVLPARQGAGEHPTQGVQCFIGPGAGPDVTAGTLLDDVAEVMSERRVRTPSPESSHPAVSVSRPDSAWFVRLTGAVREADVADLLGSYGVGSTRLARRGDRTYALTCSASDVQLQRALDALKAGTGAAATAFPCVREEDSGAERPGRRFGPARRRIPRGAGGFLRGRLPET